MPQRFLKPLAVLLWLAVAACVAGLSPLAAEEPRPTSADEAAAGSLPNLETPTWGGKQFWTDEFIHLGWRIQRHALSGHHRLLDDENVRRAAGTYEACHADFDRLRRECRLPAMERKVVLVLHGLVRSRDSMTPMCEYLEEHSDYSVLNVSYASTRETVADHAAALGRIIERLEGVDEIHFVAHSLGNLVIRHYLEDRARAKSDNSLPRMGRVVMLGPPNNGAEMAVRFRNNLLFRLIWGDAGQQLAADWAELAKRLGKPTCEFGIIAGGKGDDEGYNPLISGDDDFVVAVAETRLAGARDFSRIPVVHGAMMDDPEVHRQTLQFLQHGHFVSEAARKPLLPDDIEATAVPE